MKKIYKTKDFWRHFTLNYEHPWKPERDYLSPSAIEAVEELLKVTGCQRCCLGEKRSIPAYSFLETYGDSPLGAGVVYTAERLAEEMLSMLSWLE